MNLRMPVYNLLSYLSIDELIIVLYYTCILNILNICIKHFGWNVMWAVG